MICNDDRSVVTNASYQQAQWFRYIFADCKIHCYFINFTGKYSFAIWVIGSRKLFCSTRFKHIQKQSQIKQTFITTIDIKSRINFVLDIYSLGGK